MICDKKYKIHVRILLVIHCKKTLCKLCVRENFYNINHTTKCCTRSYLFVKMYAYFNFSFLPMTIPIPLSSPILSLYLVGETKLFSKPILNDEINLSRCFFFSTLL